MAHACVVLEQHQLTTLRANKHRVPFFFLRSYKIVKRSLNILKHVS
jgi:hypothetical protein